MARENELFLSLSYLYEMIEAECFPAPTFCLMFLELSFPLSKTGYHYGINVPFALVYKAVLNDAI